MFLSHAEMQQFVVCSFHRFTSTLNVRRVLCFLFSVKLSEWLVWWLRSPTPGLNNKYQSCKYYNYNFIWVSLESSVKFQRKMKCLPLTWTRVLGLLQPAAEVNMNVRLHMPLNVLTVSVRCRRTRRRCCWLVKLLEQKHRQSISQTDWHIVIIITWTRVESKSFWYKTVV